MNNETQQILSKVCTLAKYDADFASALKKQLSSLPEKSPEHNCDDRIDEIYEYCIETILKKQANDFYKDFPLEIIKKELIKDYVRMESFRRKDNFLDFSAALFQQIENITNELCNKNLELKSIVEKMWGYPAYIKTSSNDIRERLEKYDKGTEAQIVAYMIFSTMRDDHGKSLAVEKSNKPLEKQSISDKIKIIIYYLGFKGMPKYNDKDKYDEIVTLMKDITQCRNKVHRGAAQFDWQREILNRVLPLKSLYYFKFLGALAQFVEFVKSGITFLPRIKLYTDTLTPKIVPEPAISLKFTGEKVQLSEKDRNKKRFK